jgi:putative transposase
MAFGEGGALVEELSRAEINGLLKRSAPLWQRDYFDRIIRDATHFRNCVRYIRRNPEKARLAAGEYTLHEHEISSAVD